MNRVLLFVLGVVPATFLALLVLVFATEVMEPTHFRFDRSLVSPLMFDFAAISGTAALWIVATRSAPIFRGKKDALVLGMMLLFGMGAASVGLWLPSWLLRCLIASPIVVALSLLPSIWTAITRKGGRVAGAE
jgi:hypothetical protein